MDKFLDPDSVTMVVTDHRRAELSAVDIAVMDLAEKVVDDATSIQQADIKRLRSMGLSDEEIVDVVLAAAARCFFSKTLDALGVEPDAKYADLDPGVRDALTVGRATAQR
jgi:alkylhydroperoxidase family enzyme